jgi:hypothetical protein
VRANLETQVGAKVKKRELAMAGTEGENLRR